MNRPFRSDDIRKALEQRSSNLAPGGASLRRVFQLAVGSLVLLGQTTIGVRWTLRWIAVDSCYNLFNDELSQH